MDSFLSLFFLDKEMHHLVQVALDSPKYSLLIAINPNQIKNNFLYDANKNDCQMIA